jgi:hypothetical protein
MCERIKDVLLTYDEHRKGDDFSSPFIFLKMMLTLSRACKPNLHLARSSILSPASFFLHWNYYPMALSAAI